MHYKIGDRVKVKFEDGSSIEGEVRSVFITIDGFDFLNVKTDDGRLLRCVSAEQVSLVSD